MRTHLFSLSVVALFLLAAPMAMAAGEYGEKKAKEGEMRPATSEQAGRLDAVLLDTEKNAKERSATVEAKVQGVNITDPEKTDGTPKTGQAHIHYRLDNGPVIATTATKLSFHQLNPGQHSISVWLADNNHRALTQETKLQVNVP